MDLRVWSLKEYKAMREIRPGKMLYIKQPELRRLLNDLIAGAPSMGLDMANRTHPGLGCWSLGSEGCRVSAGSPGLGSRQPADQHPVWHQLWVVGGKKSTSWEDLYVLFLNFLSVVTPGVSVPHILPHPFKPLAPLRWTKNSAKKNGFSYC